MGESLKQTLIILGGFLGFAACFVTGMLAGLDIGQTLFNASLGCLITAMLFNILAWLMLDCVKTQRVRLRKAAQTAPAANGKEAKK